MRELAVEMEHVFSRHAVAEMSVACGILVPQAAARDVPLACLAQVLQAFGGKDAGQGAS